MKINFKRITSLVFIFSIVLLTGCSEKVYEDKRMNAVKNQDIELEYRIYSTALIDAGYNWYTNYIGDFIATIKSVDYKVNKKIVDNKIKDVDSKIDEINSIDTEKVIKMIEKNKETLTEKELEDNFFNKKIDTKIENISPNINVMKNILSKIKRGIELGNDGEYSKEELQEIRSIHTDIIHLYEYSIKLQ